MYYMHANLHAYVHYASTYRVSTSEETDKYIYNNVILTFRNHNKSCEAE